MYLPSGWTARPEQLRLYNEIVEAFKKYQFVFLDAPTGIGKSVIARALLELYGSGIVVTATKQLQDQYYRDFPEMPRLLGRSNFSCIGVQRVTCERGYYRKTATKKKREYCPDCPYKEHVEYALSQNFYTANYASVLWTARQDLPRGLLILDEGHRVENELINHIAVNITQEWMEKVGADLPEDADDDDGLFAWLEDFAVLLGKYPAEDNQAEVDRQLLAIKQLLDSKNELSWIPTCVNDRMKGNYVDFKPLRLTRAISNRLLDKGIKKLIMSATILNPAEMARSLGISDDAWTYVCSQEAFDASTRPVIYFDWSPAVTHSTYEDVKDIIAEAVQAILDMHPDDKGLIHTSSTKLASYITTTLDNPRLLLARGYTRQRVYDQHLTSAEPTVLISPSMTEGVDLHDELARFIVIAKAPFMNLGDKQVAKRTKVDNDWYKTHTIRQIIQSCGRGTRSATDSCVTYILDAKVAELLKQNETMVPAWFWAAWREEE